MLDPAAAAGPAAAARPAAAPAPAPAATAAAARFSVRALLDRLADALANPILVKELRATFRGKRFFFTHLGAIEGIAFVLFCVLFVNAQQESVSPSEIGYNMYATYTVLATLAAFLLLPAFGCTAIVTERQQKSLELLLTTTLSPRQIIWGKWTAAMSYGFVLLVSTLPLVALCFLFGGVTIWDLVASWGLVLLVGALISIFAIFISATAKSPQRAVSGSYAVLLFFGLPALSALLPALFMSRIGPTALLAMSWTQLDFENQVCVAALALGLPLGWFLFFFLLAINRLKPGVANRSTGLRLFTLVAIGAATVLATGALAHNWADMNRSDRLVMVPALALGVSLLLLLPAFFACEELKPTTRTRARLARTPRPLRWIALFLPGGASGALFSLLLGAIVYYGMCWSLERGMTPDAALAAPALGALAHAAWEWGGPYLAFLACVNAFGCLTAALFRRAWVRRVLLGLGVLALTFAPLLPFAFDPAAERAWRAADVSVELALFVSPPVAALSHWHDALRQAGESVGTFPTTVREFPGLRVVDLFGWLYGLLALLLAVAAIGLGRRAPERHDSAAVLE